MTIATSYIRPPVPTTMFDWAAYIEGDESTPTREQVIRASELLRDGHYRSFVPPICGLCKGEWPCESLRLANEFALFAASPPEQQAPNSQETKMSEQTLRKKLSAKMGSVTLDTLPAFITEALEEGGKGYGEICVALGAIAAAAAKAADRSSRGGITGFQAGAVFWEFMHQWGVFDDGPKKIVCYNDMCYPQYERKFAKTITPDTWKAIQEKAAKCQAESKGEAHPNVEAHWASIARGEVPFGYTVTDDD